MPCLRPALQIEDDILHNRTVSDFQVKSNFEFLIIKLPAAPPAAAAVAWLPRTTPGE